MKAIDRLYEYLDYKSIKPTNFEKELGLSNGYLSIQKKRNADIGESVLKKITDYCRDLNPTWLLTGNEEMLLPDEIIELREYTSKAKDEADLQTKTFTWLVFSEYEKQKGPAFSYNSFTKLLEILKLIIMKIDLMQQSMETEIYKEIASYIVENKRYNIPDKMTEPLDKYAATYKKLLPIVNELLNASFDAKTLRDVIEKYPQKKKK